jgi:phosphatidate cytidylyltransferase
VGLPIVLGALWVGGLPLLALGAIAALLGLLEFRTLTAQVGGLSLTVAGAGALAFLLAAWQGEPLAPPVLVAVVAAGLLWHMGRHLLRPDPGSALAGWALTVVGAVYPGGLLAYGLAIYSLTYSVVEVSGVTGPTSVLTFDEFSRDWLLAAVLLTFASDTGAYFTGRVFGRHKLAPRVSPGKTWEGAVGGMVFTAIASAALIPLLGIPIVAMVCGPGELPVCAVRLPGISFPLELLVMLAIGAGISVIAQAGDLAESFLKRQGNIKEAGSLLPGHGGILDRLDSIVLVLPAVYYGLVWAT